MGSGRRGVFAFLFLYGVVAGLWEVPKAYSDTFSHGRVSRKLDEANLVAEITITGRSSLPDPIHYTVTHAEATLDAVLEQREDLGFRSGDHIIIEAVGGERDGVGVTVSGYPRPYLGRRYRAYLNRRPGGVFAIAGFNHGLVPLDKSREYSRNRTDGVNGAGDGAYLRWDTDYLPIPYFIDADSFKNFPSFPVAIDLAFQSWRAPKDVRVEFLAVGCSRKAKVANDGVNNVILMHSGWPFDPDAIAISRSFYVGGTEPHAGEILDSDIVINAQYHDFTTTDESGKYDVQNIVTHEVGHLLGLGHEVDPQDSLAAMYPYANPNELTKRTLSDSDLAGLRDIYYGVGSKLQAPVSKSACQLGTPAAGCASVVPPSGMGGPWGFLVVWLLPVLVVPACRRFWKR